MLEPLQPPEPQHQAWSSKDVFTGKEGMFLEKDAGCVAELGIDIEELRNGNVEISRFMGSVSDQRTTIADLPGIQFASDTFVLKMVFIDRKGFQQLERQFCWTITDPRKDAGESGLHLKMVNSASPSFERVNSAYKFADSALRRLESER